MAIMSSPHLVEGVCVGGGGALASSTLPALTPAVSMLGAVWYSGL